MSDDFEMTDQGPVLSAQALADFERRIGATLPTVYRDFLLSKNGGRPKRRVFEIPGQGEDNVRYIFGLGMAHASMDLEVWIERSADRFPAGMLPIGSDSFGNLIVLQVDGEATGRVLFWDHEAEVSASLTEISRSFTDFLAELRLEEET